MAKPKNKLTFAPFKATVSVSLLPEMVDDITTWIASELELHRAFDALSEEGFAVAVKPKPEGDYAASALVLDPTSPNAGLMIFGNAPSALEAKAVLLVKLSFLGRKSDWTSEVSGTSTPRYR